MSFGEGSLYLGQWKNELYHGEGTYIFNDGATSSGNWNRGKRHGDHIYTDSNGQKFMKHYVNEVEKTSVPL